MMNTMVFRSTQTLGLTGVPKCTAVIHLQTGITPTPTLTPIPMCSDLCAEAEAGAGHQTWARHSLYLEQTTLGTAVLLHLPF